MTQKRPASFPVEFIDAERAVFDCTGEHDCGDPAVALFRWTCDGRDRWTFACEAHAHGVRICDAIDVARMVQAQYIDAPELEAGD